ncbi:MAG: TrmH family RNA methyltransferase, partial [Candidatus Methylophosphatis roskildensis]
MEDLASLDRVRVVLSRTSHPGNIGGAARAIKTMGLARLVLVNPRRFPDDDAIARASGAEDVLVNARVVESLGQALEGCVLVAAVT